MYIVVEFLHQVAVTVGQLLLLPERNHGPISLVDAVDRGLGLLVHVVVGHLLRDVGHAVGCRNGPAHVERLAQHDGPAEEVAGVGAQGVGQFLADGVAQTADVLGNGPAAHLLHQRTEPLGLIDGEGALLDEAVDL